MMFSLFLFVLGVSGLIVGSHFLIASLKTLSVYFKLKPLFLSIVILGFVSSSPEWFVTLTASFKNATEAALGNVAGSNIINILLVLALAGLFYKCPSDKQIIRFDIPVLIISFVILGLFSINQKISFLEGLLSLGVFLLYLWILFQKRKNGTESAAFDTPVGSPFKATGFLILGFLILFVGSSLAVKSSLKFVQILGLSERFAGVFILSLSTSLPELAASLQAAFKKERDIALGNIIGSNIFNTLFVLGSASLIRPLLLSKEIYYDGLFMLIITLILWFCLLIFKNLPKIACGIFIFLYFMYIAFTLL